MASTTSADLLHSLAEYAQEARPFLPMYTHLILSALFPIVTGSFASLTRPSSAADPKRRTPKKEKKGEVDDQEDDDEEDEVRHMEGLTPSDALVFPITAGIVLAGLYFLISRYGAEMINFILGWYFAVVGVYSVAQFINDGLGLAWSFLLPDYYCDSGSVWRVDTVKRKAVQVSQPDVTRSSPLPGLLGRLPLPAAVRSALWRQREALNTKYAVKGYIKSVVDVTVTMTRHNAFSALAGVATILYATCVSSSWYLTNLQGFAVSYGALQLMSPTSFGTGSLILSALFAYDIWAVFFTPLMVTVATKLDVPIKLVFPRPDDANAFSMLGLGDIVIPGIMIGMALRFDLYLYYLRKQKPLGPSAEASQKTGKAEAVEKARYVPVGGKWGSRFHTMGVPISEMPPALKVAFPKPYFVAAIIGYTFGLVATLLAMIVMKHAQPALLYLVPGVLISLWGTSLVRGELRLMWDFSEDVEEEAADDGEKSNPEEAQSDQGIWAWLTASLVGKRQEGDNDTKAKVEAPEKAKAAASSKEKKVDAKDKDTIVAFTVTRKRNRKAQ